MHFAKGIHKTHTEKDNCKTQSEEAFINVSFIMNRIRIVLLS